MKINNQTVKGLVLAVMLVASPLHADNQSSVLENNLNQLSIYAQECQKYVDEDHEFIDSYARTVISRSLERIGKYLENPNQADLNSIQGIEFTQTFEGMRESPCFILPTLLYDIKDGIFIDYRSQQ